MRRRRRYTILLLRLIREEMALDMTPRRVMRTNIGFSLLPITMRALSAKIPVFSENGVSP
jgi:hypothetical protein